MTYTVRLSKSAEGDLKELMAYLRVKFGEQVAKKCFARLRASFGELSRFPQLGTVIPELSDSALHHHRSLVLPPHTRVLYEIVDEKQTIQIHLIANTRQDFESLCLQRLGRI
jgi:plasmid stabilization system protein ParE